MNDRSPALTNPQDFPPGSVKTPKVEVDWFRSAPWWRLLSSTVGVSWRASHVLLCSLGLLATDGVSRFLRFVFNPELDQSHSWFATRSPLLPISGLSDAFGVSPPVGYLQQWMLYLSPLWAWLDAPTLRGTAYALALLISLVLIWSFVGGCLVRRSVVEFGTRNSPPWNDTIRLVRQRWQSIAWSLTMPACMVMMLAVIPLVIGWVSNLPWIGHGLAILLLLPTVLGALGIGWCAAITQLGFPLSVAAIVTERKADAFDGVSRSAAYSFQRPVLLFLLIGIAHGISLVTGDVFAFIVGTGYAVICRAFEIGSSGTIEDLGELANGMLQGVIALLLSSFGLSYFWSCAGAIYLLLRKDVDHAEFDLIDTNIEDTIRVHQEAAPEPSTAPSDPPVHGS
jgi:hypothetical protein